MYLSNNGVIMPAVGLGSWQSKPNEVYDAVLIAIKAGYRHIDTAYVYRNEKEVGLAIKNSGVPREELFVTTKLWNTSHRPDLVESAMNASLENLQLDYVDLYLMHWPVAFKASKSNFPKDENSNIILDPTMDYIHTYSAMEKLVELRKARAIGVSNFNIEKLDRLLKNCKLPPAVNQVELHPYFSQPDLVDFCQKNGVHVMAYSPLGSTGSPVMEEPIVLDIAERNNATPAQVLLSWGIRRGCSVIPKSVTPSRIISNFQVIELTERDFNALQTMTKTNVPQRLLDPSSIWGVDIYGSVNKSNL
ncbi:hypothetical protein INT48_000368 [Thamnidium elegans]|uniref:NADP-dependent oxidoreductase domain-containing protein n=1 Tax=Thamnidium elegans TaxID=101142 RepID=A0A8H7SNQ1_9FUNG|nr:hypothetical protein INT48_000368 [Thamnidium elegans]